MSSPARPVTRLDKTETLAGLFAVWDDIDTLMASVAAEQWRQPSPLPGWCVQDLVSHIIGTESMMAGVPTPDLGVDAATLTHVRNSIGELNECWTRHLSQEPAAAMMTRYRDITVQRRATLTALADDEWNAVTATPAGPDTYGRFMRIRTFDCWMHEHDIRQALDLAPSDTDLAGAPTTQALDEIAACMGFVVGKRGKAPDGARVAIELTGPVARTIRVAVDGKAGVVDHFGGTAPTTTITMDGLQFTRLCGGRPVFDDRPADVAYGGDDEVGRRIVEHLDYVI